MEPIPTPPDPFIVADAGALTISDLPAMLAVLFFVPGDWLLWSIAAYAAPVARLLAIGPADFGGPLSASISAVAWSASLVITTITYRALMVLGGPRTGHVFERLDGSQ